MKKIFNIENLWWAKGKQHPNKGKNYKKKNSWVVLNCKKCGCEFEVMRCHANRVYCSRECSEKNRAGENAGQYRGGRLKKNGYFFILNKTHPFANNNGYVREHRLVMEKLIGRYLKPTEVVHHIDGDRENNEEANLQYFKIDEAHRRLHEFAERHGLALSLFKFNPSWL